jgi:TMEM175 potassium channel family protein
MTTSRLEAFSDGVVAILITIMVLELRPPHEATFQSLKPLIPVSFSYLLSFVFLGIYWNNHHHLLHAAQLVNGRVLWANLHLLFWLSLIPFVTAWMGENHFASAPVALYGIILLLSAIAYTILVQSLVSLHGPDSFLANALGADFKGKISVVLDLIAVPLAFIRPWVAFAIYVFVAVMWLVPDRRIERQIVSNSKP